MNHYYKTIVSNYNWINGKLLNNSIIQKYNIKFDSPIELVNTKNNFSADSLFNSTGVLELTDHILNFNIIKDPQNYDLSLFKASVVKNDIPFAFNQEFIKKWVEESKNENEEKTVTLEGLIQDVDLYEFYLKHKEDIDNILKKEGYFKEHQEHKNVSGLNDYVINGTKKAISLCMKEMS